MHLHGPLAVVVGVAVAGLCVFVAFKVGRRWRSQFKAAVALRAHLENENASLSEAVSALKSEINVRSNSSGNVVHINAEHPAGQWPDSDGGSGARGRVGLWVPAALRAGPDSRPDVREELTEGDDVVLPL